MRRLVLLAVVACSNPPASVAEPRPAPVAPPVDAAPVDAAPLDAAPAKPNTVYAIQAIEPDGAFTKLVIGIGQRDGVTPSWRLRLVRKAGTVEPDHILVIVRIDERRLVARTKFAPAVVTERFDRVDARPD